MVWRARTVTSRLLIVVAAAVLPQALCTGLLLTRYAQDERRAYEEQFAATARAVALAVDGTATMGVVAADTLGRSAALRRGDWPEFYEEARAVAGDGWCIALVNEDGTQVLNTHRPLGATLPTVNHELLAEAMRTGETAVSPILRGKLDGGWHVGIVRPLDIPAAPRRLLAVMFDPRRVGSQLRDERLPPGAVAAVLDGSGTLIATSTDSDAGIGHAAPGALRPVGRLGHDGGEARPRLPDGTRLLTVFARAPVSGWTVAIAVPEAQVAAPLRRSLWLIGSGGLALSLLAIGLALHHARGIAGSVDTLADAAAALEEGTVPQPVALPIVAVQEAHERIREAAERLARQESDRSMLLAQLEDRVTARTGELAASEARFRLLAETTTDMIVLVDEAGTFRYVSPAAETLVGAPPETLIGSRLRDLAIAADLPEVVAFKRALPTGETVAPCIFRLRTADGRIVWVEAAGRRISDVEGVDGATGSVITLRDVSERKADEERIARAAAAAQAADRAKSEFLARMSHELRTPLNAVMGFAELLMHDRSLNAAQSEWAGHIVSGARQLLRLIEDVLDLARIEAGRLKVEIGDVEVAPLLEETMHMLRPAAEAHGVRLVADPVAADVVVRADRGRLLQVLLNLGSNAIKYNRAGGNVRLSVSPAPATEEEAQGSPSGPGWLRFTVADDGPGIPAGKLHDIFRPFSRLNEGRGRVKGTGIGLSITQQLVGLMHGRIGVVSDTGQGATFTVHLPGGVAVTDAALDGRADAAAASSLAFSVLYIEDTESATQLMHAIVGFIPGARLMTAASGIEGVRMAQDSPPDCIITDIRLPDLDGFKVLAALRGHPATAEIPVIAVSGEAMPDSVALGRSVGFFAYITKPFRLDDLIEVLGAVRGRIAGRAQLETAA